MYGIRAASNRAVTSFRTDSWSVDGEPTTRALDVTSVPAETPDRTGARTRVRLDGLAPGDYVLTVEATPDRTTVTRQVLFTVTTP
jgi:hypothetical protein